MHNLMEELAREKRTFTRFEEARMPIEDIFVQVVGRTELLSGESAAAATNPQEASV